MDFTRCVEDKELRRLRIDHDDALEALRLSNVLRMYSFAEYVQTTAKPWRRYI